MTEILTTLHAHSYTTTDLHRRLGLLQESLESVLYDEPEQMRVTPFLVRYEQAIDRIAEPVDATVLRGLDEALLAAFVPTTLATEMNALLLESAALPTMTLYVPVAFTETALAPVAQWARAEVEAMLLFDVVVDPTVVGGCAFVYNDIHFDWSLKRHLRAKRGMITSLLNSYDH